jgi:hypothetical protein
MEKLCNTLAEAGQMPDNIQQSFHRYHPAFLHKLRSAKHHLDRLNESLSSTDIQEAADITGDFMFEVNMFIDGFFYNSGSALDILARVILTLFSETLPTNVYFSTAYDQLSRNRPGDPLLPRISRPNWQRAFLDYRNTLTHELVLAPKYQIDIDRTGLKPISKIVFPLPDDPRANPNVRTYRRNPNALKYIQLHFTRILRLANTVYGDICDRAEAQRSFPL